MHRCGRVRRPGKIAPCPARELSCSGIVVATGRAARAGETAEQGVVREVREETGLTVRVEREVGTVVRQAPSGDDYVIRDFVCVVRGDDAVVAADDAADARFFSVSELADLPTSEGLIEALTEWNLVTT